MNDGLRTETAPANPSWTRLDTLALIVITTLGGALRLVGVDRPHSIVFDEVYYAKEGCYYVKGSLGACGLDVVPNEVHPPLGKWLISVGVKTLGFDSLGWRIAAVVAGTVTVALLYVLAKKLLRSTLGATLAAGLLAVDFLHFVQSRIAMLDIFVPLFGVASLLFVVLDRDRLVEGRGAGGPPKRPWRLAAGIAAGAATATKWSGALFLLTAILLTIAWEAAARRDDAITPTAISRLAALSRAVSSRLRAVGRALKEEGVAISLLLILVPVLVYTLTYVGRIDGSVLALPWTDDSWFRQFLNAHRNAASTHLGLEASHPYESPAWSWLLLKRPVSYFYCAGVDCNPNAPNGEVREILATGNPFVWWASIIALIYVGVRWVRRRSFWRPEGFILAAFLLSYVPWLALSRGRSAVFVFYLLPTVPFMSLALAYVATQIGRSWEARTAVALFAAGSIGLFSFYHPLLAGTALPQGQWEDRIWVFKGEQCDKPKGALSSTTVTTTVDGKVRTRATTTRDNSSLPPKGWCWI